MRTILILVYVCCLVQLALAGFFSKEKENTHCTELKDSIEPNILLHVPCVLIRLVEHLRQCPILSYMYIFIGGIKCDDITASGYLKKKIIRMKERIVTSFDESIELKKQTLMSQASRLNEYLETIPVNLTVKDFPEYDCPTFAYGLMEYFGKNEDALKMKIRRKLIDKSTHAQELSWPIDQDYLKKVMDYYRCTEEIKTDRSFFFYVKYVVKSLRSLATSLTASKKTADDSTYQSDTLSPVAKKSSSNTTLILSVNDIAETFYPYVEMMDKYKKILLSHSYLVYMMNNYEEIFETKEACVKNTKKPKEKFQNFFAQINKKN